MYLAAARREARSKGDMEGLDIEGTPVMNRVGTPGIEVVHADLGIERRARLPQDSEHFMGTPLQCSARGLRTTRGGPVVRATGAMSSLIVDVKIVNVGVGLGSGPAF